MTDNEPAADAERARAKALEALAAVPDWDVAVFRGDPPTLLWSASNRVTHFVSQHFFGQHYVWCSPTFDASAVKRYEVGYAQPPSSDPVSIYRELHDAVKRQDRHCSMVERHRNKLKAVALDHLTAETMSASEARECISYLDATTISDWVPVIYVIPYPSVAARVLTVPMAQRASGSPEYIIRDLAASEFHVIEPMTCL